MLAAMSEKTADAIPPSLPMLLRGMFGGALMGLANLVPGISGGTMLLASGVYPAFIAAIAEVSTLRFRRAPSLLLACVCGTAALAILLLAGPVKDLVIGQRWVMYSLFIGLTLGGVPVLLRLIGRPGASTWLWAGLGFLTMALLAIAQAGGEAGADRDGFLFLLLAGAAGAAAMILPGVSGGYLLLLLGVFVPILSGIDALRQALAAGDLGGMMRLGIDLVLPVGLGVVLGIVLVSNLLRWLLQRFERPTLGILLGLLLGAVVGLWPFQQGQPPQPGSSLKGQQVVVDDQGQLQFAASGKPLRAEDWPLHRFTPTLGQAAASLALVLLGFGLTLGIDRVGRGAKGK